MASIKPTSARLFRKGEEGQLLELMQGLARFEGYIDDFGLGEHDVLEASQTKPPMFYGFVVPEESTGKLLGMAITYIIPWTFSGRPHLVLKELFVVDSARGLGVGRSLMQAVIAQAKDINAFRLQWTVLVNNKEAKHFYRRLGAKPDQLWENWEILFPDALKPNSVLT